METAENIGFSCRMFNNRTHVLKVDANANSKEVIKQELRTIEMTMKRS